GRLDESSGVGDARAQGNAPIGGELPVGLELRKVPREHLLSGEGGALLGREREPPFLLCERAFRLESGLACAGELQLRLVEAAFAKVDDFLDAFLSRRSEEHTSELQSREN